MLQEAPSCPSSSRDSFPWQAVLLQSAFCGTNSNLRTEQQEQGVLCRPRASLAVPGVTCPSVVAKRALGGLATRRSPLGAAEDEQSNSTHAHSFIAFIFYFLFFFASLLSVLTLADANNIIVPFKNPTLCRYSFTFVKV